MGGADEEQLTNGFMDTPVDWAPGMSKHMRLKDFPTFLRYKCVEWGVAMEVGDDVRREAVEARIREAMGGDKGKEMARRAAEWKEAATGSAARSLANLDRLINDVLLSPARLGG